MHFDKYIIHPYNYYPIKTPTISIISESSLMPSLDLHLSGNM